MKKNDKMTSVTAICAMIGSAACWGGATVMSRDLLNHFPPLSLLIIQLVASVSFLIFLSLPYKPLSYINCGLLRASLTGILEPGLTYSIGLWGLSLTTAGTASIIATTEPIFIIILSILFLKFKPSKKIIFCITIAMLGLLFISNDENISAQKQHIWGDMLIVLSTFFAASYVVASSIFTVKYPASILALGQQLVGLLCVLLIYIFCIYFSLLNLSFNNLPLMFWGYAAFSGIIQYALAFWLYLIGLKYLSASTAGLWLTLTPIFGVVGAYVWLGEIPTFTMLLGMIMILLAVIVGRKEK